MRFLNLFRLVSMFLLVVFAATTLNFFLPRLIGTDPVAERISAIAETGGGNVDIEAMSQAYRERLGLGDTLWSQYLSYLGDIARFDFGFSIANYPVTVNELMAQALPWTIGLMLTATLIAFAIGSLLGALTVWPHAPRIFANLTPAIMVLGAIPFYILGLLLIDIFAFRLGWFPIGGGYPIGARPAVTFDFALDVLRHAMLPGLSIVLAAIGVWALQMRGMIVTVLGEDYVTFAEAKGVRPTRLFFRYGMRNAILPQLTTLALTFGQIVTGAVLVEVVFGYPGLGTLLFQSIGYSDFFVIQGVVFVLVLTVAISMLIMDIVLPILDPRLRG
jgi:peptide/nickel transport system permease protein